MSEDDQICLYAVLIECHMCGFAHNYYLIIMCVITLV